MIPAAKDIVLALRSLIRNPAFSAVVVATLGLGIGVNSAIFSVVETVLLSPLPFRDPDSLVMLWQKSAANHEMAISELDLDDYRARTRVFQQLAGFVAPGARTVILTGAGDPAEIAPAYVTQDYFSLLGAVPAIGRDFRPEEGLRGRNQVAILSYSLWQSRFGGARDVLDRQIVLNQKKLQVIGVMGPRAYPPEADVFIPFSWVNPDRPLARNYHELNVVGRLLPGRNLAEAQREMEAISQELARSYPRTNAGIGINIVPLREQIVGKVREPVLMIFAAVLLVLLIACGNVANLLLVRASGKQKEIAIRLALGAGRDRIIAQFTADCLVLSAAGALLGVLLAFWAMPLLRALGASRIPRLQHLAIDGRVMLFTAAIALVAGLLSGLVPVLRYTSCNVAQALRAGGRTSRSDTGRLRKTVVAAEVAIALVVAVSATLLVRSLKHLSTINPGFRSDHVLLAHIRLPANLYKQPDVESFYHRLLPKISALPGVAAVSTSTWLPLAGPVMQTRFTVDGIPPPEPGKYPYTAFVSVDEQYFKTMEIPILRGRVFRSEEVGDFEDANRQTCIVNQTLAGKFLSGQDPIGRVILLGVGQQKPEPYRIIGVARDSHIATLDAPPQPLIYFAAYAVNDNLLLRTTLDPMSLASAVTRAVAETDRQQPVSNIRTMDQVLSASIARQTFSAVLLMLFSAVGLILAALGLYGVMSYSVAQRTNEIGIRMALGAHPGAVFGMVVREGLTLTIAGLLVGTLFAATVTRLLANLLFGVGTTDPLSFAMAGLLLAAVASIACFLPAYRATRIDPLIALRYE